MQLQNEGMLVRTSANVEFRETGTEFPCNEQEETVLFKIKQSGRQYELSPINTNQPNDRLWLVIRNFKESGYKIKKHDIIKLGRMKFRVKEFRTEHDYFNELDEESPHQGFDEIKNVTDTSKLAADDDEDPNPACRF